MLHIRPATHQDLPTLIRFEQGIIEAERPFDTSNKDGEIHYYKLAEMLDSEAVHLVVAEENGEILGCGYARIEDAEPFKKRSLHSYIGFLYLEPEHRGKGVMQVIIQHLKKWSLERGFWN
jgi:GNAT superfamily N-acetyltransferase